MQNIIKIFIIIIFIIKIFIKIFTSYVGLIFGNYWLAVWYRNDFIYNTWKSIGTLKSIVKIQFYVLSLNIITTFKSIIFQNV